MASSESPQDRLLRRILGLSGALATVTVVSVDGGGGVLALAVGALALGAVPGLGRRLRVWGAIGLALAGLYLRYTGHTSTPFPAVDWIRPRGMDIWPGLLQAMGTMLLLVTGPAVMRAAGGRGIRVLAGIGAVLAIAYWFFPQHFLIDELGPAQAGRSAMPVVVDGRVERMSWGRMGMPATPIGALPEILENESRLAGIAHGMGHEAAELAGASGGGQLRATLWGIQRSATPLVIGASVLSICVAVLVVFGLIRRRPLPAALRRGATGVLLVGLVLPPVLNLLLRGAGWVGGLPEASADGPVSAILSASMLACGLVGMAAGQAGGPITPGEE